MPKIKVENRDITILNVNNSYFISLTDIAKRKSDEPNVVIANWMRNRNTIEFLGVWETLYNMNFKPIEFEGFKKEAGLNAFTLSPMKLNKVAISQMKILNELTKSSIFLAE